MRTQALNFTRVLFSVVIFLLGTHYASGKSNPNAVDTYAVLVKELITSPKKAEYQKLQEAGDVYYVIQTPGYKIYVGSFATFDGAKPTLQKIQNLGYAAAKIESIPAGVQTNLLWGTELLSSKSTKDFTPKGVSEYNFVNTNAKDLLMQMKVYRYANNAWLTSEGTFKINTKSRGIYNESSRALNFDKNTVQRIYFDFQYKNHQINPADVRLVLDFGKETRRLQYIEKDNSYQFNATALESHPTHLFYTLTSDRYNIVSEVSIPINWVGVTAKEEAITSTPQFQTPVQEYEIVLPSSKKEKPAKSYYAVPTSYEIPNSYEAAAAPASSRRARYFIQVAALGKRPDLEKFANLDRYGEVTYTYDNEVFRVKVGTYSSRSKAESTLSRVKRYYKGAYIIEELSLEDVQAKGVPRSYDTPESYSSSSNLRQQYYVKLAAYSDPSWFDSSKIDGMGKTWQVKKGRLTVKYITLKERKSPYEAKAALRDIKAAGFEEAVLMRKNSKGRLEAVE